MVVLNQGSGKLMAARVFDTYMPGAEKDMINFLNGISDGRVLCLAILVGRVNVCLSVHLVAACLLSVHLVAQGQIQGAFLSDMFD